MAPQLISSGPTLTLVAFDPAGLGVVTPARPSTAEDVFRSQPDVLVAIGGPMFSFCEGQPRDYGRYDCGRVNYALRDEDRGTHIPGLRSNDQDGVTFSVVGGALVAARGNAPAPGARVSIQTYPGLVEDGQVAVGSPTSGPDSENNGRVGLGVLRDGRAFFAYARCSLRVFAERLRSAGAVWAGYTDGGGSSSLVTRLGAELVGVDADDPRGRRLPSWVVWSSPRSEVSWGVIAALLAAAAGGGALLTVWRRRRRS